MRFTNLRRGRRRLRAPALAATAAALVLAGCGVATDDQRIDGGRGGGEDAVLTVATTTNFITDTVQRIGGDRVAVTGLMGPGVDPHLYKASAGDVRTLREADAIFYGGLFLEGKMAEVLEELSERVPTVAVSEAIPEDRLLDPPAGAAPEEEHDPHVWFDPSLWAYAVEAIRDQLTELDPEGGAAYRRNADRLLAEMRELEERGRATIAEIPERRRVLVTSHDAFAYFGRAFGLDVHAIQGISTADEATTADVERIAELIAERGVPAVFVESSVPRQTIEAVIAAARDRGHEVRIGGELYSDAAGDAGTPEGTYVGMVQANIDTIAEGLR
ncbi:MAG: zinc ABC transporter substrate-binding protein [Solirubrobacteraceae bacterium]|nr:zinc ABC transporter substrate-binding protein [Solirubrobacteraceae bacterium]